MGNIYTKPCMLQPQQTSTGVWRRNRHEDNIVARKEKEQEDKLLHDDNIADTLFLEFFSRSTHCFLTTRLVAWQLGRLLKLQFPAKIECSFSSCRLLSWPSLFALFCSRQEGLAGAGAVFQL